MHAEIAVPAQLGEETLDVARSAAASKKMKHNEYSLRLLAGRAKL
jgi:hypothetical protein